MFSIDIDNLEFNQGQSVHQCTMTFEGDLIIATCPRCPNYKRVFNTRTNTMTTQGKVDHILHQGQFVSPSMGIVKNNNN